MGGIAKNEIVLDGVSLLDRLVSELSGLTGRMFIVSKNSGENLKWGIPVYRDILPGTASIIGIHAALTVARTPHVLVLAVDLPGMIRSFAEYLISLRKEADIVMPVHRGHWEPLCAVYNRGISKSLESLIRMKRFKPVSLLSSHSCRAVTAEEMSRFGSPEQLLTNLNSPEDIRKWRNLSGAKTDETGT